MQHQASGLQQLFSGQAACVVSVLSGPSVTDSDEFVLALADKLAGGSRRVWLVEAIGSKISVALGCRPLLSWRANQPLQQQVIRAGAYGLIHAPGIMGGDAVLVSAATASRSCDYLLFEAGRFSLSEALLDPATAQTVIVLLGKQDAEAGYALVKALKKAQAPVRILLVGEVAESVAQTARHFMNQSVEGFQMEAGLYQNGNRNPETSSNTLTFAPNLTWIVSRIMQNDQPKVAYGGCGKGAEEVYKR